MTLVVHAPAFEGGGPVNVPGRENNFSIRKKNRPLVNTGMKTVALLRAQHGCSSSRAEGFIIHVVGCSGFVDIVIVVRKQ